MFQICKYKHTRVRSTRAHFCGNGKSRPTTYAHQHYQHLIHVYRACYMGYIYWSTVAYFLFKIFTYIHTCIQYAISPPSPARAFAWTHSNAKPMTNGMSIEPTLTRGMHKRTYHICSLFHQLRSVCGRIDLAKLLYQPEIVQTLCALKDCADDDAVRVPGRSEEGGYNRIQLRSKNHTSQPAKTRSQKTVMCLFGFSFKF